MMELSFVAGIGARAEISFAGDTLNTAVYLKRSLGASGTVAFVSAVGTDPYSQTMLQRISDEQVAIEHILRLEGRLPGIYGISRDPHGERSFHYWRQNSAARALFQDPKLLPLETLQTADLLYYSAITLALFSVEARQTFLEWVAEARKTSGLTVAFDSNYRPTLWPCAHEAKRAIEAAWRLADIALPSLQDEMEIFGDTSARQVLARLHGYGIGRGVLKCGLEGALPIGPNVPVPPLAPAEKVVDTTAAGDSFNGAYLAHTLTGASEAQAIVAGHECACKVIGQRGAIVAF